MCSVISGTLLRKVSQVFKPASGERPGKCWPVFKSCNGNFCSGELFPQGAEHLVTKAGRSDIRERSEIHIGQVTFRQHLSNYNLYYVKW